MLTRAFGAGIHLLHVIPVNFSRSSMWPWEVNFSRGAYSNDFSAEQNEFKLNTFWHEFYHVFEVSHGISDWSYMAGKQTQLAIRDQFTDGQASKDFYDWQPGKSFSEQTFEARAQAFGNCMSTGQCSNLEGMRIGGNGVSLSFKNGEFTLKETVTGSRIPRTTHFKPDCVEKDRC